jgi:hypothetical protein
MEEKLKICREFYDELSDREKTCVSVKHLLAAIEAGEFYLKKYRETRQKLRDAHKEEAWFCLECMDYVEYEEVTYDERHEDCGGRCV